LQLQNLKKKIYTALTLFTLYYALFTSLHYTIAVKWNTKNTLFIETMFAVIKIGGRLGAISYTIEVF
jgi:hypothetical protein